MGFISMRTLAGCNCDLVALGFGLTSDFVHEKKTYVKECVTSIMKETCPCPRKASGGIDTTTDTTIECGQIERPFSYFGRERPSSEDAKQMKNCKALPHM
jgi:hypothetical protein